jgi:hypothetical protein
MNKTREEQEAEHEAKPFPLDSYGRPTSKCTAIVENGAVIKVIITSPYSHIPSKLFSTP